MGAIHVWYGNAVHLSKREYLLSKREYVARETKNSPEGKG